MVPSCKEIVDLILKGSVIEAQEKIVDIREAAVRMQEENLQLRHRIQALEAESALRGKVAWEPPSYWVEDKGKRTGPYCQTCYDKDARLVRLQGGENGAWQCKSCKNSFFDNNYRELRIGRPDDDWRI
jgi:hypothetical protein